MVVQKVSSKHKSHASVFGVLASINKKKSSKKTKKKKTSGGKYYFKAYLDAASKNSESV